MTTLNKDRLNFLRAQHLLIFIEHITDQLAILLSAFLKPCIFTLVAYHMVVKCTTVDIQCFAYCVDLILPIKRFQRVQPFL